jgi:peroxiredoxin Q/BCP
MTDPIIRLVFLTHLGSSLYMVGLIWFVQIVHYPLFASVGSLEFPQFERRHRAMITWVVAPPMLIEGVTAVLLIWLRPEKIADWSLWTGLALLGVCWLSTALVQVPCHISLSKVFNLVVYRRLIATNWLRTAAWSLRGGLVLWMAWASYCQDVPADFIGRTNMVKLKIGDRAPDFSSTTYEGKGVRLSDYLGKRALVLFFYPKDGTSICTQEACAFRDSYEQFVDAGAEVIGVSGDTNERHGSFVREHKLSFPLISDRDGSLRKAFAVPKTWGLIPGRVTYVIDKEGFIRQIFSAQFASDQHVQEALLAIDEVNGTAAK